MAGVFATAQTQAAGVDANLTLPVHVDLIVDATDCQNSRGPQVTIEGELLIGEICAKVIFSNNAKGTHLVEVVNEEEVMLSTGGRISIPKQPSRGGVGGNPHIWLQFADGAGNNLSDEIYLGRCVQGLKVSADLVEEVQAHVNVAATGCSNHRGPWITLDGTLTLSSLNAKLIFRNNVKGTHTAEATVLVSLIGEGDQIVLPKQPVRGGVGGNPLISVQFIDCGNGDAASAATLLGRCNRL
jgi:hypothetical protein